MDYLEVKLSGVMKPVKSTAFPDRMELTQYPLIGERVRILVVLHW